MLCAFPFLVAKNLSNSDRDMFNNNSNIAKSHFAPQCQVYGMTFTVFNKKKKKKKKKQTSSKCKNHSIKKTTKCKLTVKRTIIAIKMLKSHFNNTYNIAK